MPISAIVGMPELYVSPASFTAEVTQSSLAAARSTQPSHWLDDMRVREGLLSVKRF